jgi:hypothetical protein
MSNQNVRRTALGTANLSNAFGAPQQSTAPKQAAGPDWHQMLQERIPAGLVLSEQQSADLADLAELMQRSYGSYDLMDYLSISDGVQADGSINQYLVGRVILTIPAHEFHARQPGKFQLKVLFPKVEPDGAISVNISISYKVGAGYRNTMLSTGGQKDDNTWCNIRSFSTNIADLLGRQPYAGAPNTYIEQSDEFIGWVADNTGNGKAFRYLCPDSDEVVVVLRVNKVPPATSNRPQPQLNGPVTGAPGSLSNIGGEIWLFSSTVLERLGSFNGPVVNSNAPRTLADFRLAAGRPAIEDYTTAPVPAPIEQQSLDDAFESVTPGLSAQQFAAQAISSAM